MSLPSIECASLDQTDWHPIATAPRNGDRILAWSPTARTYHVLSFDKEPPVGWVSQAADYIILREQELSHWTRLPQPPAERLTKRGHLPSLLAARVSSPLCFLGFAAVAAVGALLEHWLNLI